jgi:hypothetical protein
VTVPLPTTLPVVSGWQLVDWLDRSWSSNPAGGDGIALITLPALADNERWQLTHVVAGCTSTSTTQMRLYLDTVSNAGLRDGTSSGNFDVADWAMGLWVPPGRSLLARWAGCSTGSAATLNLQAAIYRRVGG